MISMRHGLGPAALALALCGSTAALADVKAGADAWTRGDYVVAVREWQGPAAAGDPDALFNLGQAYRLGRGVAKNLARAETLFSEAAAKGHVTAADIYGLLRFDRGDRAGAMPYVRAAAERGDPRAQYLLGIAHFNGDLAAKDWTRAYAYMTLAQAAGLPQAAKGIAQMDQYVPLPQRQAAATLASQLSAEAEARRTSTLAAADLAPPVTATAAPIAPVGVAPAGVAPAPAPQLAVAAAQRTAGNASPATAGADYARPAVASVAAAPAKPAVKTPSPATKPAVAKPAAAATGPWRVQLGAFGLAANADALWAKVKGRPELAGHRRIDVAAGKVRKLQAGGFASREAAAKACTALAASGLSCIPVQD